MIILDSNVLLATLSDRDQHCAEARGLMDEIHRGVWGTALVPDYALVEVVNFVIARQGVTRAREYAEQLIRMESLRVEPCSGLFADAMEVFRRQGSRGLSFTDAAIVAMAMKRRVRNVASFDREFLGIEGLNVIRGPRTAG